MHYHWTRSSDVALMVIAALIVVASTRSVVPVRRPFRVPFVPQVLKIVYLNPAGNPGGFFPDGLNGKIV